MAMPRVQSRETTQPSPCCGHCWALGDQRIKPMPQETPQAAHGFLPRDRAAASPPKSATTEEQHSS